MSSLSAVSDTRTISMYQVHTKESITITYKKDGRYIPSALRELNRFLRDWRKNEIIKIDPEVIDLVWELHEELGSKKPVHIICGYRNEATNKMLKGIGRNVAKTSMHTRGQAIDIYFPDVSSKKLRNHALVHQVGGVGYYASSGPNGFVHVDSGRVRHWPAIPNQEFASIMRNAPAKAKRDTAPAQIMVAEAEPAEEEAAKAAPQPEPAKIIKKKAESVVVAAADVPRPRMKPELPVVLASAKAPVVPSSKPDVPVAPVEETVVADASPAKAKELENAAQRGLVIMASAAADIEVAPASAPAPEQQSFARPFGSEGAKTSLGGSAHPVAGAMSRPLPIAAATQASISNDEFWKEQNLKFSLKPHFFNSANGDPSDSKPSNRVVNLSIEEAAPASSYSFLPPVLSELTRLFLPFETASVEVADDGQAQAGGPEINRSDKGNLLMSHHVQTTINGAAKGPRMDLASMEDLVSTASFSSGPVNMARARSNEPEPIAFKE
ncbi:uncharacterized protein YcbK (DUF882 family) [Rhodoligotrophos appendicifer]|uniref:DUF882 domain-containing protein n=1 Tax=Rhodoligotrophos appendicifer TaxID=987056 RepID=UPI001185AD0E|nr:DUF882 domain-containing protein [Rhodoligotrophos appendicifer]